MDGFASVENWVNLGILIFLQAVLGFDNLLYVSIESKRAPEDKQQKVRRIGILLAIALRMVLLFVVVGLLDTFEAPFFELHNGFIAGNFNFATIVFLVGGVFIMYTAVKEIRHMIAVDNLHGEGSDSTSKSAGAVIGMIVLMNLVFSFDSILSAVAITRVFWVLLGAIGASGLAMLLLADRVAEFLQKNRKYEVLGLFILLIVGVVLLGEGGHEAHLSIFGYEVEPMSKMTFYFSIIVLVVVDILQTGYQKKLAAVAKSGD